MKKELKEQLLAAVESEQGVNFDLACGDDVRTGYIGIDNRPAPNVDIVLDLEKTPYKDIPSDCAGLMIASHIVEHFKPWLMVDIMNEWWRILKVGGQLMIATPYAGSPSFWQDPTHTKGWIEVTPEYFAPFGPLSKGNVYKVYKPKPWKILKNTWDLSATLEVLMEKIPDDPSYHKVG
jgi:SAM-dependent methyltransferase